jgi:hypothetical protein
MGPQRLFRSGYLPIHNQFTTSSNVVDGILKNLGRSGGFNDDARLLSASCNQLCPHGSILKAVWVVILDLLELNFWVRTGEFDVFLLPSGLLSRIYLSFKNSRLQHQAFVPGPS